MQTYTAFIFRLALHVVEGNIHSNIYPVPLWAEHKPLLLFHLLVAEFLPSFISGSGF